MAGALDGVTVLEVADYVTGPYAGMLLADLGARVVKIEKRGSGDPFRGFDPAHGGGYDVEFLALNRNKQSLTLDLASARGRDVFLRLADGATVAAPEQFQRCIEICDQVLGRFEPDRQAQQIIRHW